MVSAFEDDRVVVADDSSRRVSLIDNINRESLQPPERCSYRMSIQLEPPLNKSISKLHHDQLGHYRTTKVVDAAIAKLEELRLLTNNRRLNVVEVILVLIVLGYVRYHQGKEVIRMRDVQLVEELMGFYCESGETSLKVTKLIGLLCLLEGNETGDSEFYRVAGRPHRVAERTTPTDGERQRAQQRFS